MKKNLTYLLFICLILSSCTKETEAPKVVPKNPPTETNILDNTKDIEDIFSGNDPIKAIENPKKVLENPISSGTLDTSTDMVYTGSAPLIPPVQKPVGVAIPPVETAIQSEGTRGIISPTQLSREAQSTDTISSIRERNESFDKGLTLSENKEYAKAIETLEKAKSATPSKSEQAVIDFNISSNQFALDRLEGAREFMELIKNEKYPPRTRALAMQRIFLLYRKYNDESILREIAKELTIPWTTRDGVVETYMQKSYTLYPLAGSALYLVGFESSRATDTETARAGYAKYEKVFEASILSMAKNPGESTEYTAALLRKAGIKGSLHTRFGLFAQSEIEAEYKDLIQFDQTKGFTVNKQYALISYANFLAGKGEDNRAVGVLEKVTNEGIDSALREALPKSTEYTNLEKIKTDNTEVQKLINFIGS